MLPEIWEPNLTAVFVGTVVTEPSTSLGFYHLHPRDRFWELLEMEGITPKKIITPAERKALTDGQRQGSVSDPVRVFFLQKKTSQLLQLGIGMTDLNRRMIAENEKDRIARPTPDDVRDLVARAERLKPGILAFVTTGDIFVAAFKGLYPTATDQLGPQVFMIGTSEVWLLGSTSAMLRGEALEKQENAFFALGERVAEMKETNR
jgi:G:T/U-mismatch repair DNA glycosylase